MALEAEYGRPPERDSIAGKRTPGLPPGNDKRSDGEKESLLIECWMGQKWGFYKFPIDPVIERPQLGTELLWRDVPLTPHLIEESDMGWPGRNSAKVAYGFDLKQPLPP